MSRGINKAILVGTLGRDPEVKYMPSGGAITNITIATNDSYKDKNTGEKKEITEWHRVVFFNKLAEIAGEYLRKGQQVYVEGSLKTRKWQGQDGQDRYTTEIVASDMQMLGGRASNGESQAPSQAPSQPQSPPQRQNSNAYASASQRTSRSFEDFDDDIPF